MRKRTSNMGSARELTRGEHEASPIADAVSVGAVGAALQLDEIFPIRHSFFYGFLLLLARISALTIFAADRIGNG